MHNEVSVGEKIRHRREDKNITQHELAKLLGITPAAVCQWERRGIIPRPKTLAKVARALGVPATYLTAESTASSSDALGSVSTHIGDLKTKIAEVTGVDAGRIHVSITIADCSHSLSWTETQA